MDFGTLLSGLMAEHGLGVRALARRVPCDPALVSRLAAGRQQPSAQIARRLDAILAAGGELALAAGGERAVLAAIAPELGPAPDDAHGAVEAARRAGASDVGAATVERLEQVTDALAVAYAAAPPQGLLGRAGTYLDYATRLLGGRLTLGEHRRLLVTSGWLSLLTATSLIDLRRQDAAAAYVATAAQMAGEAEHADLAAWCLETRAWQALISRDYPRAAAFARDAQAAAPRGSSVLIQATAQEGRAWARLGAARETYDALARVEALVSPLPVPERPEHHYVYDPSKAEAYVATTLAWIGDPAAERIARHVLERIESGADGLPRPRRAVAGRLDLALALAATGRPDEAAAVTLEAITSGWMVPSHCWRAEEAITVIETRQPAGAGALRAALAGTHPELAPAKPDAPAGRKPDGACHELPNGHSGPIVP